MNDFEDEPPCVHHRSQFDTEPCPAHFADAHQAAFGDVHAAAQKSAGDALRFEGGDVPLPKPTRAELVLSAQQWVMALREELHDEGVFSTRRGADDGMVSERAQTAIAGKLGRLDAVLAELAAL